MNEVRVLNLENLISKYHLLDFKFKGRYIFEKGGRASGKSHDNLGVLVLYSILSCKYNNAVIVRQNDYSNKQSTFNLIIHLIGEMGMGKYFATRVNPLEITYLPTGQVIYFRGANNPDTIKSIVAPTGWLNRMFIEECNEIPDYETFNTIDKSIRRGDRPNGMSDYDWENSYCQIIGVFNSVSPETWLKEEFFDGRLIDNQEKLEKNNYQIWYDTKLPIGFGVGLLLETTTTMANTHRETSVDLANAMLKQKNLNRYRVDVLGMWGETGAKTYPSFCSDNIVELNDVLKKYQFIDFNIGIDTGLSNGAGKILKKNNSWVESATVVELCGVTAGYEKEITLKEYFWSNDGEAYPKSAPEIQSEIADTLQAWEKEFANIPNLMKGRIYVWVDNADIGFRQNLENICRSRKMYNYIFNGSTKTSILNRVRFEDLLFTWGDKLICSNCTNLIREFKSATGDDKGNIRADGNDHAINTDEYGFAPVVERMRRYKDFKPLDIKK